MATNNVTKQDFEKVKSMQRRNWSPATILAKSGWSEKTTKRMLRYATWAGYRAAVKRETEKIKRTQAQRRQRKHAPQANDHVMESSGLPLIDDAPDELPIVRRDMDEPLIDIHEDDIHIKPSFVIFVIIALALGAWMLLVR